jgi:hypothetical protein
MLRRHRRFAALVAIVALTLSACSRNDAKRSDVVDAMTDAKLSQEQANCVGDGFEKEFGDNQDLFNKVAAATDPEDLPDDTESTVKSILDQCVGGGSSSSGSTDTTAAGGDATTTTAATGATTTTAAG